MMSFPQANTRNNYILLFKKKSFIPDEVLSSSGPLEKSWDKVSDVRLKEGRKRAGEVVLTESNTSKNIKRSQNYT